MNNDLEIGISLIDSNLIYKQEFQSEAYLGRILNLSNLEFGNYRLVIKSNNRTFVEILKKEK